MFRLINRDRLNASIENLTERNFLISDLTLTKNTDELRFYKFVLAFWLGSTSILVRLKHEDDFKQLFNKSEKFILNGYYCILTLEKSLSLIQDHTSLSYKKLDNYRSDIFECFNYNYDLLIQKPNFLFSLFEKIIREKELPSQYRFTSLLSRFFQNSDQALLDKTKLDCLDDLQRELDYEHLQRNSLFSNKPPLHINDENVGFKMLYKTSLSVQLNKFITASFYQFPFYLSNSSFTDNKFHIQNILVEANDGIVLHSLKVTNIHSISKRVVLALIGHFPNEDGYISLLATKFCDLFNAETVFINHRNYSQRSAKLAESIDQIAVDIVCFANYFKNQNKEIFLYGMCGGSAHMILAAQLLLPTTKFKLIIDRFSCEYIQFMDAKTFKRNVILNIDPNKPLNRIELLFTSRFVNLLYPAYLFYMFVAKSLLILTNNNRNFGDIVKKIPEENVLILQAKSKKPKESQEPIFTDLIVHPQNDIRNAIKQRRKNNKLVLKNLTLICKKIVCCFPSGSDTATVFHKLSDYFLDCLKLIQNENLTGNGKPTTITDLHSSHLTYLKTRNNMPISQFISGFFMHRKKDWQSILDDINTYSTEQILTSLNKIYNKNINNKILAEHLNQFLQITTDNKKFIYYISNRLFNTEIKDISLVFHDLICSALFRELAKVESYNKQLFI